MIWHFADMVSVAGSLQGLLWLGQTLVSCWEVLEKREDTKLLIRPRQARKAAENYAKNQYILWQENINLYLVRNMLLLIFKWGQLSLNWPNVSFRVTFGR